MNRMMDRHPLSAVWGDLPSGELVAMRPPASISASRM